MSLANSSLGINYAPSACASTASEFTDFDIPYDGFSEHRCSSATQRTQNTQQHPALEVGSPELTESTGSSVSTVLRSPSPWAEDFFRTVQERVKVTPLPKDAERLLHPNLRLLTRICVVLQENTGCDPFWLSCRDAGRLLGVDHGVASRFLDRLCRAGILKLIRKGVWPKASEYRLCVTRNKSPHVGNSLSVTEAEVAP
jgi:hypothetical protein